jgi:DNA-binding PadR family transcriptional regulator
MQAENGALTETVFYILLSMYQSMHGYGVMQNAEKLSNGRVILGAGTLYGAINTLLKKGWIIAVESAENSRKKEYIITESGKKAVATELQRLEELLRNGRTITEGIT